MSNLKPQFGPKVCLAPPCQAFNLTLGQNPCLALPHVKLETRFGPKVCLAPPCQAFNHNACFALPHVKFETQNRAKGLCSPTMPSLQPYIGGKTLVLRSRMSNLKPKFGPKVCLAPPCQAFNLILGAKRCFALPHVKLETQIRAKGLSSPTMPSLEPYIGPKHLFCAPACQKLETPFRAKGLSSPTMPSLQPYIGAKRLFKRSRMSNLKPKFGPKVCLAPLCQACNLTLGQNACSALPHVKLETQNRAKGLSSPTMPSFQPYIGAKRLFCAPACQT